MTTKSKTKYKIWIEIEKINEGKGVYKDVDEPISIGEFDNLKKALLFRDRVLKNIKVPI